MVWWLALAAAGCRVAVLALGVVRANPAWLATHVQDDGYYYLEIAQRIARGEGTTLDGINSTNGFHPLWEGVLSFLALFFHGQTLVKATLLVGLVMVGAALIVVGRMVRRRWGDIPAAGVVVAGSTIVNRTMSAMETPVLLLALSVLVWALARYLAQPDRRSAIFVGLACGVVVLARLDFLTVVWLVPVALGIRARRLREVAVTVAGLAVLAVPWFAWSWVKYGHALPVSGSAKLRYVNDAIQNRYGSRLSTAFATHTVHNLKPVAANAWYRLSPWPNTVSRVAVLAILAIAAGTWLWRRTHGIGSGWKGLLHAPEWWSLMVVGAVIVLQYLVVLVALPGQWLYAWYADLVYATAAVGSGLGLGLVVAAVGRHQAARRSLGPVLGVALVVVWASTIMPLHTVDRRFDGTRWPGRLGGTNVQYGNVEASAWLRQADLSGRIGAFDNGWLSFSLDPTPVENLDGLANSYRYLDLLQGRKDIYQTEGLRYLVTWAEPTRIPPCAHRVWRSSAALSNGVDPTSERPPQFFPVAVFDLAGCAPAPRP